jgi:hypothetical protein
MTADEVVAFALALHGASFTISLGAQYAIFGDKFIRPTLERADAICARLRGELTHELLQAVQPFAASNKAPVVASVILGGDGAPLDTAQITNAVSLDSEAFTQAVRGFLDAESADFNRYWLAFKLRAKLRSQWNWMRLAASVWPIFGLLALAVFWSLSKQLLPVLPHSWLCTFCGVGLFPPLSIVAMLPSLAWASVRLEKLEV